MDFKEFLKNKSLVLDEIWVYGLGTSGRLLIDLCRINDINVSGIIVGNGYKEADNYQGITIYELRDVSDACGQLFYSVKQNKELLLKDFATDAFLIIDFSSTADYITMLEMYYNNYWEKRAVVIGRSKIMKLGEMELVNARAIGMDYYRAMLSEAGDLLLPPIWNDYERIDEGAYEYSSVLLNKDDVVIDCGANIGVFSAVAAWKGANVYAFEPQKDCFGYLQKQSNLHSNGTIYPVNAALSDHCGEELFYYNKEHVTEFSQYGEGEEMKVSCLTVDAFVKQNGLKSVDFIKADIEGGERNMLLGAKETLKQFAPKLAICTYHRPDDKEVLTKIILDANPDYKVEYKWKKLFAYTPVS